MRIVMYPGFMSASEPQYFKKSLGALLVYRNRNYLPQRGDFVIGWGNSHSPNWANEYYENDCKGLNHWSNIALAVNKRKSLEAFKYADVSHVPFTLYKGAAQQWSDDHHVVMCRIELKGMRGAGIVVGKAPHEIVDAPLYTKYLPDCREFRVHVFGRTAINIQEKKRKLVGVKNEYIRSEENGWVFARKNLQIPITTVSTSIAAIKALGLDFGAVDILYSPQDRKSYVLEVNTAPGVAENELCIKEYGGQAYTDEFMKIIRAL